jgi:hypothetical protein
VVPGLVRPDQQEVWWHCQQDRRVERRPHPEGIVRQPHRHADGGQRDEHRHQLEGPGRDAEEPVEGRCQVAVQRAHERLPEKVDRELPVQDREAQEPRRRLVVPEAGERQQQEPHQRGNDKDRAERPVPSGEASSVSRRPHGCHVAVSSASRPRRGRRRPIEQVKARRATGGTSGHLVGRRGHFSVRGPPHPVAGSSGEGRRQRVRPVGVAIAHARHRPAVRLSLDVLARSLERRSGTGASSDVGTTTDTHGRRDRWTSPRSGIECKLAHDERPRQAAKASPPAAGRAPSARRLTGPIVGARGCGARESPGRPHPGAGRAVRGAEKHGRL